MKCGLVWDITLEDGDFMKAPRRQCLIACLSVHPSVCLSVSVLCIQSPAQSCLQFR